MQLGLENLDASPQRTQWIANLVGQAGCHLSNSCHFLLELNLLFTLFDLGQILDREYVAGLLVVMREQGRAAQAYKQWLPLFTSAPTLDMEGAFIRLEIAMQNALQDRFGKEFGDGLQEQLLQRESADFLTRSITGSDTTL